MFRVLVSLQVLAVTAAHRLQRRLADDRGQSTAEYALVLLGAAGVAVVFMTWATKSGKVTRLLDEVIAAVLDKVP